MLTRAAVGPAFGRFFVDGPTRAAGAGAPWHALWDAMAVAAAGGKRLRPALVVATHDALGGTDARAAAHVADAVELLHTAFLAHDDVIDHDTHRRGRPTVSGAFRERALAAGATPARAAGYGDAAGILAGDLALVGAVRLVARTPADPRTVSRLLDLLDDAVTRTAAGELGDVHGALRTDRPDLADALAVAELKTAVYSFALPMQAGAVLAGARDDDVARLGTLGSLVGVAYQLHDDLLGTFGDEAGTGKSTVSDLREGKVTALVAHARTTSAWPLVARWLGADDLTPAAADEVRELLVACGSRAFVEGLVADHVAAARTVARELGRVEDLVDALTAPLCSSALDLA